jgi:ABC-2 type transport system ATP-binding protein
MHTNSVICADALTVRVDGRTLLDNLNFNVGKGEVFALLGGNGAGKSTTLKTFLGLMKASSGSATVLGQNASTKTNDVQKTVAYLPESVTLYGHLSGLENIRYFLSVAGVDKTDEDIFAALRKVALQENSWKKALSNYSKGMRQKTAIALALLRNAPVLFLDEPTSGLDPAAIDEFNALVSELAANGATIFMVTHDVYGACQVAHRIVLLSDGKLTGSFEREADTPIDTEAVHAAFAGRTL